MFSGERGRLGGTAVALFKCKGRALKAPSDNGAIIGRAERSDFPLLKKARRSQQAKGPPRGWAGDLNRWPEG